MLGALCFGRLADRLGRKRLFMVTLAVYMRGHAGHRVLARLRVVRAVPLVTGVGIGGEYAAINSAIDELIPARVRGRVNLAINGSFWIGAALGAGSQPGAARRARARPGARLACRLRAGAVLAVAICWCAATCPKARAG